MKKAFSSMLSEEMQRLCVTASDRLRLSDLIKDVEGVLSQYEEALGKENVSPKQQLWERKLLDLTFRNNLLNMKVGKKVAAYSPCPIDELEDLLADGLEYEVKSEAIDFKTLQGIYRTSRTMLEESGANCLFLTLGTLRYEGHAAPLLLVPIDLVPAGRGRFYIRKRDEETMFNFTLIEFLKQNYGIELSPYSSKDGELPTDAHGLDVDLILHLVANEISGQEEWSIEEDSYIGIFSFVKYIMWKDIHSHGSVLHKNPLLRSLIEGRLVLEDIKQPADARDLDDNARPSQFALPMPCDSSQLEAVVDAAQGRTFVLYGPPGTGKSQTITNIIANALYQGKRVLFVAQKKAALDVVEQRLDKIGIGPFCLEMHSNKMNKQNFLNHMDAVIQLWQDNPVSDSKVYGETSEEVYNRRQRLKNFLDVMCHQGEDGGMSLYECISRFTDIKSTDEIHQKPHTGGYHSLSLQKDVKLLSRKELDEVIEQCVLLDAGELILGVEPEHHPLAGLHPDANVRDLAKTLSQDLSQLKVSIERAEKQAESSLNSRFMQKTADEILKNDYRWKHFVQIARPDESLLDDFEELKAAVARWQAGLDKLEVWLKYLAPEELLRQKGLADAIEYHVKGHSGKETAESIEKGWLRKSAEKMIKENPVLSEFNGALFEQVIEQYRTWTNKLSSLTKDQVSERLLRQISESAKDEEFSSELTLLRKRIASKGRGSSIRSIMEQMPHLLPSMAPCMLMSPLSVAQYVNMEANPFDIVVFDEASQMPTCEAVGSIARGKSVVVVGDPKQMPPTSFFTTATTDEENMEMEDLDSILDDFISLSLPSRYLSWHYRSQHESLISFSNKQYYDGRLLTFPSVDCKESRVSLQHVDGYYDYGKTRTNRAEAEAIVADVAERLNRNEKQSIGIVAFSKPQSDLIEDLLTEMLEASPELMERANQLEEPVFVKNLENAQGDERDVILFSVGYGPDREGRVSMNFGPLNQAGGERRLNVAVSRARAEMKIFSTLTPSQIDENRTSAEGVIGLKRFLEFASQNLGEKMFSQAKRKNSMIAEVASKLSKLGYEVSTNVGLSNLQVDIAIAVPQDSTKFKLGIICDGENYQNLKTMRDRELVQPGMLQNLGWKIMHLWSVDWFVSPDPVLKRICSALTGKDSKK